MAQLAAGGKGAHERPLLEKADGVQLFRVLKQAIDCETALAPASIGVDISSTSTETVSTNGGRKDTGRELSLFILLSSRSRRMGRLSVCGNSSCREASTSFDRESTWMEQRVCVIFVEMKLSRRVLLMKLTHSLTQRRVDPIH